MRAHYLQHAPFEGLGSIEPWLLAAGYEITCTRLFDGEKLPAPGRADVLVALGGAMSVHDLAGFPWLAAEKQFLRDTIAAGGPVLGICLGAQLIASALGAEVHRLALPEIGWFPVQGVLPPDAQGFVLPPTAEVFHWHGETFDLPPGARRLARSAGCENQAFQLGRSVIGLQFHLEATPELVAEFVAHGGAELVPSHHVQTGEEIRSAAAGNCRTAVELMDRLLTFLLPDAARDRAPGPAGASGGGV